MYVYLVVDCGACQWEYFLCTIHNETQCCYLVVLLLICFLYSGCMIRNFSGTFLLYFVYCSLDNVKCIVIMPFFFGVFI